MGQLHHYQSHVVWQGSTAAGYAGYDQAHRAVTPPAIASGKRERQRWESTSPRLAVALRLRL